MAHRHRAKTSAPHGWTHCVADQHEVACSGMAHGGVTYQETCSCGATRDIESNGPHRVAGSWQEKPPAIVVRDMKGQEVRRIEMRVPLTERHLERVMSGLLTNMDTDNYFADDSECEAWLKRNQGAPR